MTKRQSRRELALRIRNAVLSLESWRIETLGEGRTRIMTTDVGELQILRTTPAANLKGMPAANGIDIWGPKGKVFSIWWNERKLGGGLEHQLKVVAYAKGDSHAPLLAREAMNGRTKEAAGG